MGFLWTRTVAAVGLVAAALVADRLSRQGSLDEHRLAVAMPDATPFLVERFDLDREYFACHVSAAQPPEDTGAPPPRVASDASVGAVPS